MNRLLIAALTVASLFGAELKVGKALALKSQVGLADLIARPEKYVGQTIQVRGKITEVCQMMGCWMMLTDDSGAAVRIQIQHGVVAFPKDASGRSATAEGKFAKFEMTKEEALDAAKHEAEEQGRKFNPDSVKGPVAIYQIEGTGAVLD